MHVHAHVHCMCVSCTRDCACHVFHLRFSQCGSHSTCAASALTLSPFQLFAFILSCVLYRDQHTVVAALEALHTLLSAATTGLAQWLASSQPNAVMATAFWGELEGEVEEEGDKKSISSGDTQSLGEVQPVLHSSLPTPHSSSPLLTPPSSLLTHHRSSQGLNDSYFAPSDPDSESGLLVSLIPDPPEDGPPVAAPITHAPSEELACLSLRDGPSEPLASLVQVATMREGHRDRYDNSCVLLLPASSTCVKRCSCPAESAPSRWPSPACLLLWICSPHSSPPSIPTSPSPLHMTLN